MVRAPIRDDGLIRPVSNLEGINLNGIIACLADIVVCWVNPSQVGYLYKGFHGDDKAREVPLYSMSQFPVRLSI